MDRDFAAAAPSSVAVGPAGSPSARLAEALLAETPAGARPWHYEHSLLILAADRAGKVHGGESLLSAAKDYIGSNLGPDGEIAGYREDEYNLDQINPGRLLLTSGAASRSRAEAAIDALAAQLRHQPRCACGGYWHKRIYPDQMWLDGLYMAGPFSIALGRRTGRPELVDEAVAQLRIAESKTRDGRTGLLYHAWDESRRQLWSDPATGRSPHFWGRAIGWFAMALVDCLDFLPKGHAGGVELAASLGRLAEAVPRYQDVETGLWHQVLDQGSRNGNYLETSASSMFAYAFLKADRKGYLSGAQRAAARSSGEAALRGVSSRMLEWVDERPSLKGICAVAGLGGDPYRDGSFEYYATAPTKTNDPKGTGPYILALLESEARSDGAACRALTVAEESIA